MCDQHRVEEQTFVRLRSFVDFFHIQNFQLTFHHFSICQWPEWVVASTPDNDDVVVHDEGGVIASIPTAGACVAKVVGTDHEDKKQWNVPNLMLPK